MTTATGPTRMVKGSYHILGQSTHHRLVLSCGHSVDQEITYHWNGCGRVPGTAICPECPTEKGSPR